MPAQESAMPSAPLAKAGDLDLDLEQQLLPVDPMGVYAPERAWELQRKLADLFGLAEQLPVYIAKAGDLSLEDAQNEDAQNEDAQNKLLEEAQNKLVASHSRMIDGNPEVELAELKKDTRNFIAAVVVQKSMDEGQIVTGTLVQVYQNGDCKRTGLVKGAENLELTMSDMIRKPELRDIFTVQNLSFLSHINSGVLGFSVLYSNTGYALNNAESHLKDMAHKMSVQACDNVAEMSFNSTASQLDSLKCVNALEGGMEGMMVGIAAMQMLMIFYLLIEANTGAMRKYFKFAVGDPLTAAAEMRTGDRELNAKDVIRFIGLVGMVSCMAFFLASAKFGADGNTCDTVQSSSYPTTRWILNEACSGNKLRQVMLTPMVVFAEMAVVTFGFAAIAQIAGKCEQECTEKGKEDAEKRASERAQIASFFKGLKKGQQKVLLAKPMDTPETGPSMAARGGS